MDLDDGYLCGCVSVLIYEKCVFAHPHGVCCCCSRIYVEQLEASLLHPFLPLSLPPSLLAVTAHPYELE